MQTRTYSQRHRRGFSLVELLIVVAVIGIIAAMAVLTATNTNKNARVTAAQAQAQRIASVFAAGMGTGAPGFGTASGVPSAMNAVGNGSFGSGANREAWFQLPGITASMDDGNPTDEQAKHYLAWENNTLVYSPEGVSQGGGGNDSPPPPDDNTGWYLLQIVPTPIAGAIVAQQDQMHPQDMHRARDLGGGMSAIEWKPRT